MCERGRETSILFCTGLAGPMVAVQWKPFTHRTQSVFARQLTGVLGWIGGKNGQTVKRSIHKQDQPQQQRWQRQWKRHEFLINHLCPHTIFITFTQFIQKAVHAIMQLTPHSHTHTRALAYIHTYSGKYISVQNRIEGKPDHMLLTAPNTQMTHKRTHSFFRSLFALKLLRIPIETWSAWLCITSKPLWPYTASDFELHKLSSV